LAAITIAASLCGCAPSNRPAPDSLATPAAVPAVEYATEAPRHSGSSPAPRIIRHRSVEKRQHPRRELQQADAEWVNPPLGAGE
jgi:hypothetical protein